MLWEVITNEGDKNMVVAASINADGTLVCTLEMLRQCRHNSHRRVQNLDRAVVTHGSGAHGITDPNGPDALFSQGAIKASAKGQVLATVNVGLRGRLCNPDAHRISLQAGSNTISLFSINPKTPTEISLIGNPIGSSGEFPMSLAFNADGTRLCTLNGGAVNGVAQFIASVMRAVGPAASTSLFASSLEYNWLGGNLGYVVLTTMSIGVFFVSTPLPAETWPKEEEEEED